MKKLLFAAVAMILSITSLSAEERVIMHSALPAATQSFISANFPADKISIATEERGFFEKDYKVILTSGVKLEFDSKGEWIDIESTRNGSISSKLIPTNVAKYVAANFPNNSIVKIERDKRSFEVSLNNDIDLKFNHKGDLVEIDN